MRKAPFVNGEIYHIYNRGVEKRDTFMDDGDRLRFLYNLFEFNDSSPPVHHSSNNHSFKSFTEVELRRISEREPLVEILAFCLMPNHYHLLVRQKVEGGIVRFMQKLGTGYTNYFNTKYERVGGLFQGKFKSVLVERDEHFLYIPYYIHCNALDLKYPKWKRLGIKNPKEALEFLENYRWSSFKDYIGKENFPLVLQKDFLLPSLGDPTLHKKRVAEWLNQPDFSEIGANLVE